MELLRLTTGTREEKRQLLTEPERNSKAVRNTLRNG